MMSTFDPETHWGCEGCWDTLSVCHAKFLQTWLQRFMTYCVHKLLCAMSQW